MSVIVLLAFAIVTSAICHKQIKGFISASVTAALVSAIMFHIVGYFVDRYLDKFILISLVTTFGTSLVLAMGIGFIMEKAGTRRGQTRPDRPL